MVVLLTELEETKEAKSRRVRKIKRLFYPGEVQGTYYMYKRCYQVDVYL